MTALPSPRGLVGRPSTDCFKPWIARVCLLSTAGSTATALQCVERTCRGRLLVVKIDLSMSWDVLRGGGPPVAPYCIAPVQTFLCVTRRHLPDQSVVYVIGFLLAQFHELARRTSRRVLFDAVDCMLQFVDTNVSSPFQSRRMDCHPISIDVGRAAQILEWIDGQARLPICKARIGLLHARMSVMFVKRCNGEGSWPHSFAHIRIDLISLVRVFDRPALVPRPLQTRRAPNLISRFACRLHFHCRGQPVPRKCSRHCAADDCQFGEREPIESCIDGAETQMSCCLAVI